MFMGRRHANEWNEEYPELHYVAPLSPGDYLWEAISKYKRPGETLEASWIGDVMLDQGYTAEEVQPAIEYCLGVARVLVFEGGIFRRDARPYGAFGPEHQWKAAHE